MKARHTFLKAIRFACSALFAVCSLIEIGANEVSQDRPNIVFVLADDLGYSDVGFNGQRFYETPSIDALAREGMILSDFYSGGPNGAPTRACIHTGMYTPLHKLYTPSGQAKGDVTSMRFAVPTKGEEDPVYNTVESMRNTIDGDHTSIAEVLGAAGYVYLTQSSSVENHSRNSSNVRG